MNYSSQYNTKIPFYLLIFIFINIPIGHSTVASLIPAPSKHVENPPPVEKVKPPAEKKKKKRTKKKRKFKQAKKLMLKKKKKPSFYDGQVFISVLVIVLLALLIAGAIMLGLGVWYLATAIAALSMIGVALLTGYILAIVDLIDSGIQNISVGTLFFAILAALFNLIAGLYFLIWGITVAMPLAWVAGIILLALLILLTIIYLLVLYNN